MTIDELYEAYMDIDEYGDPTVGVSFADDIFNFFELGDKGWSRGDWVEKYGKYMPVFDPSGTEFAERERDLAYEKAWDTLDITQKATDRVYKTELDTLSTELGREMQKGKAVAGGLGLRTSSLESAIGDTVKAASTKTKDLGDRLMISEKETLDKHNISKVHAALDYDKSERQEKEDFFDDVMAQVLRLSKEEPKAFGDFCPEDTPVKCSDGTCVKNAHQCEDFVDVCGDLNGTAQSETECVGYTTPEAHEATCIQQCRYLEGNIGAGGQTCIEACMDADADTDPTDGTVRFTSSEGVAWSTGIWFEENRDYIDLNKRCRDEGGTWICTGDDPNISDELTWKNVVTGETSETDPEEDTDHQCMHCYSSGNECGYYDASYAFVACDPGCCPG